ncbi:MAG: Rrf2 family transcriptional regulator [Planctomycetes bacterium]|nr:Rrf2 family transcriptional regulator [Planctomycetota bacterium]
MLQLTKRTEYGLIALVHMADRSGTVVSVREISERYPVPRRLLAEVLKDLGRANLVESQRGATGGYVLARPAASITLGEIVCALEGAPSVSSCETLAPARDGECELEPRCPIRSPLHRIREGIWSLMERTTLSSLVQSSPLVTLEHPVVPTRRNGPTEPQA